MQVSKVPCHAAGLFALADVRLLSYSKRTTGELDAAVFWMRNHHVDFGCHNSFASLEGSLDLSNQITHLGTQM
jgi:hypothetical protein